MATHDWGWLTDEMFRAKLEEIVNEMGTTAVLAVPGVYEILAEELNNTVLEELRMERSNDDE
jgi:hypothetical protein